MVSQPPERHGRHGALVIVVSPRQDVEAVTEVVRGGAGYLVEGDSCTCMLSSAVVAATVGRTYLSPTPCAALRDVAQPVLDGWAETEWLRAAVTPRAADHGAALREEA